MGPSPRAPPVPHHFLIGYTLFLTLKLLSICLFVSNLDRDLLLRLADADRYKERYFPRSISSVDHHRDADDLCRRTVLARHFSTWLRIILFGCLLVGVTANLLIGQEKQSTSSVGPLTDWLTDWPPTWETLRGFNKRSWFGQLKVNVFPPLRRWFRLGNGGWIGGGEDTSKLGIEVIGNC